MKKVSFTLSKIAAGLAEQISKNIITIIFGILTSLVIGVVGFIIVRSGLDRGTIIFFVSAAAVAAVFGPGAGLFADRVDQRFQKRQFRKAFFGLKIAMSDLPDVAYAETARPIGFNYNFLDNIYPLFVDKLSIVQDSTKRERALEQIHVLKNKFSKYSKAGQEEITMISELLIHRTDEVFSTPGEFLSVLISLLPNEEAIIAFFYYWDAIRSNVPDETTNEEVLSKGSFQNYWNSLGKDEERETKQRALDEMVDISEHMLRNYQKVIQTMVLELRKLESDREVEDSLRVRFNREFRAMIDAILEEEVQKKIKEGTALEDNE